MAREVRCWWVKHVTRGLHSHVHACVRARVHWSQTHLAGIKSHNLHGRHGEMCTAKSQVESWLTDRPRTPTGLRHMGSFNRLTQFKRHLLMGYMEGQISLSKTNHRLHTALNYYTMCPNSYLAT